jgi:hypothetical protein
VIGKPEQWLIEAASSIGLDYSALSHEITNELIGHCIKRHGDRSIHRSATITDTDFALISGMVKTPDYGTTYLYFEEVMISRKNKALRGKTLYKVTRPLSPDQFLKNVSRNGKSDISKAWILNK